MRRASTSCQGGRKVRRAPKGRTEEEGPQDDRQDLQAREPRRKCWPTSSGSSHLSVIPSFSPYFPVSAFYPHYLTLTGRGLKGFFPSLTLALAFRAHTTGRGCPRCCVGRALTQRGPRQAPGLWPPVGIRPFLGCGREEPGEGSRTLHRRCLARTIFDKVGWAYGAYHSEALLACWLDQI